MFESMTDAIGLIDILTDEAIDDIVNCATRVVMADIPVRSTSIIGGRCKVEEVE